MGNLHFREFDSSDNDFQVLVDVVNDMHGHRYPTTLEEQKYFASTHEPGYFRERYIIQQGAKDIGVLIFYQSPWNFHPQKYRFDFDVFRANLNDDVLADVWRFIQDKLGDKDIISYCAEWNEYQKEQTAFFIAQGFEVVMRYPSSELVLADFDFARFEPVVAKVKAEGIEIISVEELKTRDNDWIRTIWALEVELDKDVPTPEETLPMSYDVFVKKVENNPRWDMAQMFVAVDGDKPIGLTRAILPHVGTQRFGTGMTGVLRSHRRRGIATALKVVSLRAMLDAGGEVIETDNEENNPMYQINMQLGFKPIEAWVDYECPVKQDD